jgi:hypothetical protein
MKIDVFCHLPPPRYLSELNRRAGSSFGSQYARYDSSNPGLTDLDVRFRILDKYPRRASTPDHRRSDPAIRELGFCGVEIFTDINGKPVDAPEFWLLYEKMQDYDLPILLHPRRTNMTADYPGEPKSNGSMTSRRASSS